MTHIINFVAVKSCGMYQCLVESCLCFPLSGSPSGSYPLDAQNLEFRAEIARAHPGPMPYI